MIKLEGTVLNVFTQQGGKDKDRWSVCWSWQGTNFRCYGSANGDVKNELFTLSVENYRDFSDLLNKKISIAVGAMASGRNVIFTSLKAHSLF